MPDKVPGRPQRAAEQASRRVQQQAVATPTRVRQFTGSGVHVRQGACEVVELQPDCSDLWRLGDVAERLRDGAVRRCPAHTCDSHVNVHCDANIASLPRPARCTESACAPSKPARSCAQGALAGCQLQHHARQRATPRLESGTRVCR